MFPLQSVQNKHRAAVVLGLCALLNNDAKIDLVFVDQLGVIRIHFN